MDERARFMNEWEHERSMAADARVNMAALCRAFGVSRQTGYKWLRRYLAGGRDREALADQSRRPRRSPRATPGRIVEVVVGARRMYPRWGARKLHAWLLRRVSRRGPFCIPRQAIPAPSTIGAILRREGLTRPRRSRPRTPPMTQPFGDTTGPNATWCVDFKGHFRTKDGATCYPLTIMDAYSRKLLRCVALRDPNGKMVRKVFESAFDEYGLPIALRSDNGPPFASVSPSGLSRISVWWTRLGIRHERIEPGKPQQNGRHERMHRTLRETATTPPAASLRAQQKVFDWFVPHYNTERPHEALGGRTPDELYAPSPRRPPASLERFEYPPDCEVRRVQVHGFVRLTSLRRIFIGTPLAGEWVAFRWLSGQKWEVLYGPLTLGIYDLMRSKMIGRTPKKSRLKQTTWNVG
jgi:transposase InsO family protein